MSKKATQKPAPNAQNIEFFQYHQPALKAGNYILDATQTVRSTDADKPITEHSSFTASQTFSIAGERFTIKPNEVLGMFPPPSSGGDHAFVMPHIILSRSTLPWEREGQAGDSAVPWLGLLLFDAAEAPTPQVLTYKALFDSGNPNSNASKKVNYVHLDHEPADLPGQHDDEKVKIIDIPAPLARAIIPTAEELSLLTHVRQWLESTDNHKNVGAERSVCICNRLPKRGRTSVIHLVSFEGRYNDQGKFDFGSEAEKSLPVRLVTLKSWRFSCTDEESYKLTLAALNKLPWSDDLKQKGYDTTIFNKEIVNAEPFLARAKQIYGDLSAIQKQELLKAARYKKLTFKSLLMELNCDQLRLPSSALKKVAAAPPNIQKAAESFRQRGYVPLPHQMRNGQNTISWYHGPLQSGITINSQSLPVRSADELLRIHPDYGMLDVSYAAAWELGRLLTLQSKRVSTELFKWKRVHAQNTAEIDKLREQFDHLPFKPISPNFKLPDVVENWFEDLRLLKGIPFNYLIPDQRMLPLESLRFFNVDTFWIEALLDGAFSIGRITSGDYHFDERNSNHPASQSGTKKPISGFIMRSDVVAGWPDLRVVGYNNTFETFTKATELEKAQLPLKRQKRLSDNTMIVLFEGTLKATDIHQKQEVIHFGFSEPDTIHPKPYKRVRQATTGIETQKTVEADFKSEADVNNHANYRLVDCVKMQGDLVTALGDQNKTLSSAGFALQMIEGVGSVRFNSTTP